MADLWTRTQQCMMGKGRPAATTADVTGGQRLWWGAWLVDKLAGQRSGCASTLTGINSRFLHRHASRVSLNVFTIITEHKNPVSVVEHSRLLWLPMRTELLLMAAQACTSSNRCCGGSSHLFACLVSSVSGWFGLVYIRISQT